MAPGKQKMQFKVDRLQIIVVALPEGKLDFKLFLRALSNKIHFNTT